MGDDGKAGCGEQRIDGEDAAKAEWGDETHRVIPSTLPCVGKGKARKPQSMDEESYPRPTDQHNARQGSW